MQCVDVPECRDPLSLQAVLCSVIYLQGSGQLPMCYTYVSMAMTAAIRLGLHQGDSLHKFNTIERETRRRIFWTLRVMDSYITTVLDLPRTLSDEETDQAFPKDVDDIYVTLQGVKRTNEPCLMASVNAHTKLTRILSKVKSIASGSKDHDHKPNSRYQVDYAKIVDAEKALLEWTSSVPTYTKLPDHNRRELERLVKARCFAFQHTKSLSQSSTPSARCARSCTDGSLSSFPSSHRSTKYGTQF